MFEDCEGGGALIRKAFLKSLPVMAGYVVLGMGFGILLRAAGYGPLWALAMSLLIYAGSMQYVGVGLIAGGASVERYRGAGVFKPYLVFALTDETYSLLCDGTEEERRHVFCFLVSLLNHLYWVAGSVAGSLLGQVLPFGTEGIEFSMTALFVASLTEQWMTHRDHVPALTGLGASVMCLVLFGPDRFLVPAMVSITLVLMILRGRGRSS